MSSVLPTFAEWLELSDGERREIQSRWNAYGGEGHQLVSDVAADFRVSLDLLVRVVGSVDWDRIKAGRRDLYLRLYEHFLDVYDPVLPRQCSSRDTPLEVVDHAVPEQG